MEQEALRDELRRHALVDGAGDAAEVLLPEVARRVHARREPPLDHVHEGEERQHEDGQAPLHEEEDHASGRDGQHHVDRRRKVDGERPLDGIQVRGAARHEVARLDARVEADGQVLEMAEDPPPEVVHQPDAGPGDEALVGEVAERIRGEEPDDPHERQHRHPSVAGEDAVVEEPAEQEGLHGDERDRRDLREEHEQARHPVGAEVLEEEHAAAPQAGLSGGPRSAAGSGRPRHPVGAQLNGPSSRVSSQRADSVIRTSAHAPCAGDVLPIAIDIMTDGTTRPAGAPCTGSPARAARLARRRLPSGSTTSRPRR